MKTKFGNAFIDKDGYYRITSSKEGNNMKLLHRLIFEDFYGFIPKGFHIHHKNGNKLDNCILNLQLISPNEHQSVHNKNGKYFRGKKHSLKHKIKMSERKNSSNYFRVVKQKCKTCKNGFIWNYRYYENGKRFQIVSVDINDLKEKVIKKGLIWIDYEEKGYV